MATVTVLGRHGFIGKALSSRLSEMGYTVIGFPSKNSIAIFNFSGPTHLPFEENVSYHLQEAIQTHLYLLDFCTEQGIYYVWPSSALIYEKEKETPFKHCKIAMEELQKAYHGLLLGLRIFPVYGNEKERGKYATAIYQWCVQIKKGERPIIYGDGNQARDFIYLDDVIDTIVHCFERGTVGIMDVGAGKPTTFNNIIRIIDKNVIPIYIKSPQGYSAGISCQSPVPCKTSLREGIDNILKTL